MRIIKTINNAIETIAAIIEDEVARMNLPMIVVGNIAVEGERAACGLTIYGSRFFNSMNKP